MPDLRRIEPLQGEIANSEKANRGALRYSLFAIRYWLLAVGSIERPARHGGKVTRQSIGNLAGDRQLALALESLDRRFRFRAEDPVRLHLAVAEIRQRALHREHAPRRC